MFFTRKTHLIKSDFFDDFTDFHSHILYGVDDGVKSISESLDVLRYYETLGIKRVVLTPHINLSCNDWELIDLNFKNLLNSYKGSIQLSLAAEYMIDSGFADQIKLGLKPIKGDMVLVESSYLSKSVNFEESLYDIMNLGLTPVIAHPERYLFMEYSKYKSLKDCDYLFQLNLLSLAGYYGKRVKVRALKLLEDGMYNMIGSDIHNLNSFVGNLSKIKLSKKEYSNLKLKR